MNLRTLSLVLVCAISTFGCVGGGGDGGGGDPGGDGGDPGSDGGAGGVGGGGGEGGAGGAEPGECAPNDPANLVAIFDAVAAAGGGAAAAADQINCSTACGVLSACMQTTCGVADQTQVAFSVSACLMACMDRDEAAVGAVLAATGMATCVGIDDDLCDDWFAPGCGQGGGGMGGGGMGGGGMGGGGMGGEPDLSDCDPERWCPATACMLDCGDEACARACVEDRCGPDGEACRGCPMGDARPVCAFCAEAGFDDVCSCDLGVVCDVVRCGAACDSEDEACRDACAAPCEPRSGTPCACTPEQVMSCL